MFRRQVFLILSMLVISSFSYASVNDAVKWLYDNQNPDYSFGDMDTTGFRDTCVVTETLLDLEGANTKLLRAIDYIEATEIDVCDYLARKISALDLAGRDVGTLANTLASYENNYYLSFGYQKDDLGSPLDTCMVLKALLSANYSEIQVYVDIVNFLLYTQSYYGYWRFSPFEASDSIYCTGQVVLSLVQLLEAGIFTYPADINTIKTSIYKGTNWLKGQQNQDGGFGKDGSTIYETSIVGLAFLSQPELRTSQNLKSALNYIRNNQKPDGSWNNRAYDTGIALKSLTQQKVIVSPTSGTIGTIVEIAGKGFGQTESISIDFGITKTITTSITNAKGTFTATFTIDIQSAGMTAIKATGLNSNLSADTYFKIISVPTASISIEPDFGCVGSIVTVIGQGFGQTEAIVIDFGITQTITTTLTDGEGKFSTTFIVDTQPGCGTITVSAKGKDCVAYNWFRMLGRITLVSPQQGTVGTLIEVSGDGFAANERIEIDFGTNPTIAVTWSDNAGRFKAVFTADTQPGCGTITVSAKGKDCVAYSWFRMLGRITLVSPQQGTVGTIVAVSGDGFAAKERIEIDFGTNPTITITWSDNAGRFWAVFTADTQPGCGTITVSA
ncbi:MAG: prenyltransferase/squalene oxidase repeat-containing protein, partial [bacterium]